MARKTGKSKEHKQNIKLVRLTSLSKSELSKMNFQDLWLMKPALPGSAAKIRYCRCRSVCYV